MNEVKRCCTKHIHFIAGKYIVLMPNTSKGGGISRKIFNPADRKKIRTILK